MSPPMRAERAAEGDRPRGYHRTMFKPAFSTVACPEWPLELVAQRAAEYGFPAVELRTFGDGSRRFASEPAFTAPEKTRAIFARAGVQIASLATGASFQQQVLPPVIGHALTDTEAEVRHARRCIDTATTIECPLVRVFGFRVPNGERRASALARIAGRIKKVADHADRTGVRVCIETGGSFAKAGDVLELVAAVNAGRLVGVCLNVAATAIAGDDPVAAVAALGDKLLSVRVKDLRAGRPVPLGRGELPLPALLDTLVRARFDGPVIFEWDRAWLGADVSMPAPEQVLPAAAQYLFAPLAVAAVESRRQPAGV